MKPVKPGAPPTITYYERRKDGVDVLVGEIICYPIPAKIMKLVGVTSPNHGWHIHRLWVRRAYRKNGIGGMLLDNLIDMVARAFPYQPVVTLRLTAFDTVPERVLRRFYTNRGFQQVGTTQIYTL